jgi:hypothetical protein
MSGVEMDGGRNHKLLIMNNLLGGFGQERSEIQSKVNHLVHRAVFVADDQPRFRVVLGDQEPESASILWDVKDEIGRVGLARPQRLCERSGCAMELCERGLSFQRWCEAVSGVIHEDDLPRVRRERSIPAMGGDSPLIEPRLHSDDDEFSARGDLLHLRAHRSHGLRTDERISKVAIDFAKVLPASRRQGLFAASEGNAGEEQEIPVGNREGRTHAEHGEEGRAASGAVEFYEEANPNQLGGAEEQEHDDGSKVGHEFRHAVFSSFAWFVLPCDGIRQCAASAFAHAEFLHGCFQISRGKFRPALLQKHEFRKGAFPQEKIG